jgi:hypothetical protein
VSDSLHFLLLDRHYRSLLDRRHVSRCEGILCISCNSIDYLCSLCSYILLRTASAVPRPHGIKKFINGRRVLTKTLGGPKVVSHFRNIVAFIVHTYHSRFIPVEVAEASQICLRDVHVLPKLFSYELYCKRDR